MGEGLLMARVVTVANQKGGAAKTTTAQALATGAAEIGRKVLAIDLDPQANLTFFMGGDEGAAGAYQLLRGDCRAIDAIQPTAQGCDLIGASYELAVIDGELEGDARRRARRLRDTLRPVIGRYDVVVIDTPPSLGIGLICALVASSEVVIPMTTDISALKGLRLLVDTIEGARGYNKGLQVGGVLFTRWSGRTVQARDLRDVITETCEGMGVPVYETAIREAIAAREAQTYRASLFEHAPKSTTAQDYRALIEEMGL